MLLSAEVRWFWRGPRPSLYRWFAEMSIPPGGGGTRIDTYLIDRGQTELGIKIRGSKPGLEIKALVGEGASFTLGGHSATSQIWTKLTTTALTLDHLPTVSVQKKRWLRRYDAGGSTIRELALGINELSLSKEPLPNNGCNVEFTEVGIEDLPQVWVTLGIEAFGSLDRIESSLQSIVQLLDSRELPDTDPGAALSYPQWLAQVAPPLKQRVE